MSARTPRSPPRPAATGPALGERLAVRLGLRLLVGAGLVLLVAGWWNLRLERQHLTALVSASADRIAETIRRATRDAMLRNDVEGLHRTIDNIGAQRGIVRIRVFNKEGRIRTSTRSEEVGTLVDIRAEQCYGCHQQGAPLVALERDDRVRLFEAPEGGRILGIIAPIHNEPQCTGACHAHPPEQRVLGVLDVQLSMGSVDEAIAASERQLALALAATVAAMALLSGLLVWRMVLRPAGRLRAAMERVGAGDLEARVPELSRDEMGAMARAWNRMTGELQRARDELEDWNRMLEERVQAKTVELERTHERMLLVEKMASLGKLAAVVAHELNNPLAGIRTFARLLLRRVETPDAQGDAQETRRVLEMVETEAARCGEIVRNLLLFGRASAARFAPADVPALLKRCVLLLQHRAEMAGVALDLETPRELPPLTCDASQVEQMVLALVMNAIEATPAGGRVLVSAAAERDAVLDADALALRVADTGTGIPEEMRERVFEPFFTTKESGTGVGLGLAVVYGIVNRHHGRIDFEPRPGGGTLFEVLLPLRQVTAGEDPGGTTSGERVPAAPPAAWRGGAP